MKSDDAPFDNILELQTAHLELMQRQQDRLAREGHPLDRAEVGAFLDRVRRTGAVLPAPEDRRSAQRVLDYWSADLLDISRGPDDSPPSDGLAPYEPLPLPAGGAPADGAEGGGSREYIRLAAQARQWRDTRSRGYLVSGKALRSAEKFSRDPEIADLIAASLVEERRNARRALRRKRIAAGLTLGLLGSLVLATVAYREAGNAVSQKEEAVAEAVATSEEAVVLDEQARLGARQTDLALRSATAARSLAQERTQELEQRQHRLDEALGALADVVSAERLPLSRVPESVRDEVLGVLAIRLAEGRLDLDALAPDLAAAIDPFTPAIEASVFSKDLNGYDPGFLDRDLPLPALAPALIPGAYRNGEPVPYLNFSFVFDRLRRAPLFAATNLDRMRRRVLPATETSVEPDPRLPPELRPDPGRFAGGLVPANYVWRTDITWGPLLEGNPIRAARLADQSVQIHLNKAPVHPATAAAWEALFAWLRDRHNTSVSRVTFFSGPVFRRDEARVPAALWLIAVSVRNPLSVSPGAERPFVAEAFLIPNRPDIQTARPWDYVIPIEGIERATGLVFPDQMIEGDRGRAIVNRTEGDRLADRAGELDRPPSEDQSDLMQTMGDVVSGRAGLPGSEQARVVTALLAMLGRMAEISTEGRANALTVLNEVPQAGWNRPDWVGLKAVARHEVARLKASGLESGPGVEASLAALVPKLGLDVPQSQTVYLQFAGMTRERARTLASEMRRVGWTLPGEERVAAAETLNEVRFNPQVAADADAARLLAADLGAAGRSGVRAVANPQIRAGNLEIWIGGSAP